MPRPQSDFVSTMLARMPDAHARMQAAAVLRQFAGATINLPVDDVRSRRIREVVNMLANGMSPGDCVAAIRERWGLCDRTGWRYVKAARQMSVKEGGN